MSHKSVVGYDTLDSCQECNASNNSRTKTVEYYIQWKGKSHLHDTWETEATLLPSTTNSLFFYKKTENILKPVKQKLDNYKKKQALKKSSINNDNNKPVVVEDPLRDLLQQFTTVERILGMKEGYYLCKWKSLPYSEATWEMESDINTREASREAISVFHKREQDHNKCCVSSSSTTITTTTTTPVYDHTYASCTTQPSFLPSSIKLFPYQLLGLDWLLTAWADPLRTGVILADEMGLGKTLEAISLISTSREMLLSTALGTTAPPSLVIVPLSTLEQWSKEFKRFASHLNVVLYIGNAKSRSLVREYEWRYMGDKCQCVKIDVLITTYEMILKDKITLSSQLWSHIVIDEAHRLKNQHSELYTTLQTLFNHPSTYKLLLTGTPIQNCLHELWCLLYFIQPQTFGEEDRETLFTRVDETLQELQEQPQDKRDDLLLQLKKDTNEIEHLLELYLLRRIKRNVDMGLPRKTHMIIPISLTKMQQEYYKMVLTKNFKQLNKNVDLSTTKNNSLMNIMMDLKKVCNHPFLFSGARQEEHASLVSSSGKLKVLDTLLSKLFANHHRVLIFSQMVKVLDLLEEFCTMKAYSYQRIDGSTSRCVRDASIEQYNAKSSTDFVFLLSTRAGGLGINLTSADTVIMFDSDWNPQNDLQAEARCHRVGQVKPVVVYKFVCKGTVEEEVLERSKHKLILDHVVIQSRRFDTSSSNASLGGGMGMELNEILKFGAQELFASTKEEENEEEVRLDIDRIIDQAEKERENSPCASAVATVPVSSSEKVQSSSFSSLLNSFKTANDLVCDVKKKKKKQSKKLGTRAWAEIIPKEDQVERSRVEEKIEQEEEEEETVVADYSSFYLPQRKTRNKKVCYAETTPRGRQDEDQDSVVDVEAAKSTITVKESKKMLQFNHLVHRMVMMCGTLWNLGLYKDSSSTVEAADEESFEARSKDVVIKGKKYITRDNVGLVHQAGMELFRASCVKMMEEEEEAMCAKTVTSNTSLQVVQRVYGLTALEIVLSRVVEQAKKTNCPSSRSKRECLLRLLQDQQELSLFIITDNVVDVGLLVGIHEYGCGNWKQIVEENEIIRKALFDNMIVDKDKALKKLRRTGVVDGFNKRAKVLLRMCLKEVVANTSLEGLFLFPLDREGDKEGRRRMEKVLSVELDEEDTRRKKKKKNKTGTAIGIVSSLPNNALPVAGILHKKPKGRLERAAERAAMKQQQQQQLAPVEDTPPLANASTSKNKIRPKKLLSSIKQTLRKLVSIHEWSSTQSDVIVCQKLCKYIGIIGTTVDRLLIKTQNEEELNELRNACWKYVETYTPAMSYTQLIDLYEDIKIDLMNQREREEGITIETEAEEPISCLSTGIEKELKTECTTSQSVVNTTTSSNSTVQASPPSCSSYSQRRRINSTSSSTSTSGKREEDDRKRYNTTRYSRSRHETTRHSIDRYHDYSSRDRSRPRSRYYDRQADEELDRRRRRGTFDETSSSYSRRRIREEDNSERRRIRTSAGSPGSTSSRSSRSRGRRVLDQGPPSILGRYEDNNSLVVGSLVKRPRVDTSTVSSTSNRIILNKRHAALQESDRESGEETVAESINSKKQIRVDTPTRVSMIQKKPRPDSPRLNTALLNRRHSTRRKTSECLE